MMRQFYRNRHASFLQGLQDQKAKKEKDEQAIKQAEERKQQKIKQQVLGDESRIRSKFKEALAPMKSGDDNSFIETNSTQAATTVPAALASLNKTQLNSTTKSNTSNSQQTSANNIRRGNSISSLSHVEISNSGQKRQKPESRGSTRAVSTKGVEKKTPESANQDALANRSAQNFNRGRTLTPKVNKTSNVTVNKAAASQTAEEKLAFDEKRE